jgi:hypothetical protein
MRHFLVRPVLSIAAGLALIALISVRSTSAGDATTAEGCMNQWMFNGIWRVQVTKVEPFMDGPQQVGWQVTEVWRNGTTQNFAPGDFFTKPQQLQLTDGTAISTADTTTSTLSQSGIDSHGLPASGQWTAVLVFRSAKGAVDAANKPKALIISFDNAKLSQARFKPQFSTKKYDYRIKLDCVASAAAAAQGGSSEIPAKAGCMNEWMSNGIWKVRATAVGPDYGNDNNPSNPQIGWMITEDWVNLTARPLAPGDTNTSEQQIALASGNTIAVTNSAGASMNWGQLMNRSFAPGSSFTYQQRFRQGGLDPNDKPAKLIVPFDAVKQNARVGAPHYTVNPPNFRISFACTK